MRLDHIIQTLLPHDEHFYKMFNESVGNISEATVLLKRLPDLSREERVPIIAAINYLEHAGDQVTHDIFNELNSTFVTPFDPEDIHILASALDDILDLIDGCARRFDLYKIGRCPQGVTDLIECLSKAVAELKIGIFLLKGFKNPTQLREIIMHINSYENDGDTIFAKAVADLFDNETSPIEVIKMKEILVLLETATDKCEDAADVLDTIVLKHA